VSDTDVYNDGHINATSTIIVWLSGCHVCLPQALDLMPDAAWSMTLHDSVMICVEAL